MSSEEFWIRDLISKVIVRKIAIDESAPEGWTSVETPARLTLRNYVAGLKVVIERTTFDEYGVANIQSALKAILINQAFEDVASGRIG